MTVVRVGAGVLVAAVLGAAALAVGLERGWVRPNDGVAARYEVHGLDVSHHQGDVDWGAVAEAGEVRFVWIKATEGGDWTDPRFDENWREVRAAGLVPGAYHYFTLCTPGRVQAEHFLATVPDDDGPRLPLAVDLEHQGNCAVRARLDASAEIGAFARAVAERATPLVVYTTREFHRTKLRGRVPLTEHPLWIRGVLTRAGPIDGQPWTVWQHTSRGAVPGVVGPVDRNVFAGTREAFDAWTGSYSTHASSW